MDTSELESATMLLTRHYHSNFLKTFKYCASLWLKGLQNCWESKLEVQKKNDETLPACQCKHSKM